jgi:hypothetical protein
MRGERTKKRYEQRSIAQAGPEDRVNQQEPSTAPRWETLVRSQSQLLAYNLQERDVSISKFLQVSNTPPRGVELAGIGVRPYVNEKTIVKTKGVRLLAKTLNLPDVAGYRYV